MSHIIHRNLEKSPITAVSGKGCYLKDIHGKLYLDACGGAAVSCLGHGHREIISAMHKQIDHLAYAHTSFFTTDVVEELADHLIQTAPSSLNRIYFVSGGSEAMETSLKLARQYFVDIGEEERTVFLGRSQSYHGNTLGALAVGGNEWRKRIFSPLLMNVERVAECNEYRGKKENETVDQYTDRLLKEFEKKVYDIGPHRIIAFCAETVVGATSGAIPPTPGYLRGIYDICRKYGILYIADEVMCGMGRTGTLHAFEQDDFIPDIVAVAKGLGGGYQPIGAVFTKDFIIDAIKKGTGFFQHGHTYICHPTAAAAALAVQKIIFRDNLVDHVKHQGDYLFNQLQHKLSSIETVGNIRGRGLFLGIELVQNKESKQAFDPSKEIHKLIKKECFEKGLMVYPMGGTIDGQTGDHILLAPPFIIKKNEIDFIVDTLDIVIQKVTSTVLLEK
ncbi:aspartate aminotransferase family protein [Acinetobacter pollinis]|uniref:aspartate aminotransferase family protein n=1 Tax=Acinetobacter pollinis TaxID=2605270 RepID=UPI0018A27D60|nr:aspartate aminotransferase family protein [Acinetobacter pollinis]MBF7691591.1 aspartate aminotransferase family protein [Acinetobacter pollinis]MBF7693949.1 aspartate aminotransferase family protein [Acinetobacter pollinis]MBF7699348.1 aspartate aminotransferase family protein [Acinetobacter pollinis]MBF7701604.1 aspartate aminotransferase family protein [Acinetobacter pollinis]